MKDTIIRQAGKSCEVLHGDKRVYIGGRVAAKKFAVLFAKTHGSRLLNMKRGGKIVSA